MKKTVKLDKDTKYTKIQELTYELKVSNVMTNKVVTVTPGKTIYELRELFRTNRISGTPVVDKGKLIGIISIEDFIKCLAQGEMHTLISEKMTKRVKTLYADEPIIHAVRKFDQYGIGRFPVIEREGGKLVGIITKGDIIKGLLKKLEIEYHQEEIHRYRASHIFEDIIADSTSLILKYNIVGKDFNKAGECASGLKKTFYRLGIQPDIVRRAAIATYEAEMNIVVFTEGGRLTVSVEPQQIKIEADDSGPGIPDIKQAMQPGFSTASEWVRELGFGAGMGLPNIKNCTDKINIESKVGKGTHLETIIYLNNNA
ncbi:MAG: CBS domain-containing protein [Candidatus Stahlbacteria bacterium]|nr:CBS domain-containing protein [Candidatus Stahlbacteria bacterium]